MHLCSDLADCKRRLVRVAEGASLESLYTGNCIEGSNPSVSAKAKSSDMIVAFFMP